MKASSAIPFICRPYTIDGYRIMMVHLAIRSLSSRRFSSVVKKCIAFTLPKDTVRTSKKDANRSFIRKKYPLAAEKLEQRAERYNQGVAKACRMAEEGEGSDCCAGRHLWRFHFKQRCRCSPQTLRKGLSGRRVYITFHPKTLNMKGGRA